MTQLYCFLVWGLLVGTPTAVLVSIIPESLQLAGAAKAAASFFLPTLAGGLAGIYLCKGEDKDGDQ